jgi:hypothetical protein
VEVGPISIVDVRHQRRLNLAKQDHPIWETGYTSCP